MLPASAVGQLTDVPFSLRNFSILFWLCVNLKLNTSVGRSSNPVCLSPDLFLLGTQETPQKSRQEGVLTPALQTFCLTLEPIIKSGPD